MCVQTLHLCQNAKRLLRLPERLPRVGDDRPMPLEILNTQAGEKPRGSTRRQHMRRPSQIVPYHLRRLWSHEHGTRTGDT